MNILVIGSNGQLGKCLKARVSCLSEDYKIYFFSKEQLDVRNLDKLEEVFLNKDPRFVINASGFTNVDKAEENFDDAIDINGIGVKNISNFAKKNGSTLIHISSDYVFDGLANSPYKELDSTSPLGKYGESKLLGENYVIESGCSYIILRTSWVFSEYGSNFLLTMIKLFNQKKSVSVIGDQIGCPTYAMDIANAIYKIINNFERQYSNEIYHFCGDSSVSWFNFAENILEEYSKINNNIQVNIESIRTQEYKTLAKRPKYSVLDCSKIYKNYEIKRSNWRKGIKESIHNL